MFAQLGQPLNGFCLVNRLGRFDPAGLEPVVVVGQINHHVRAHLVHQLGQGGRCPASFGRAWYKKTDVAFGALANQGLSQRITCAQ